MPLITGYPGSETLLQYCKGRQAAALPRKRRRAISPAVPKRREKDGQNPSGSNHEKHEISRKKACHIRDEFVICEEPQPSIGGESVHHVPVLHLLILLFPIIIFIFVFVFVFVLILILYPPHRRLFPGT